MTFNRRTNSLLADARLINRGQEPLDAQILALFERIAPAAVELDDPHGMDPRTGRPYVGFSGFGPGGLAPGQSSDPLALSFSNPDRWRFGPEIAYWGPTNAAPYFTSSPITVAAVGVPLAETVAATDPDGHSLQFALLSGPQGMTLDKTTGELAWTPTGDRLGLHEVRYRVSDGRGGRAERVYQLFVGTPQPDRPPVFITRPPTRVITAGQTFGYIPVALDPEGFQVQSAIETLLPGLTRDPQSGEIQYTPPEETRGSQRIEISARDPQGNASFQAFTVTVRGPNSPPVFSSQPSRFVTAGSVYRYDAVAVDAEDLVTHSLIDSPDGAQIDPHSGRLTWATPDVPGEYSLTVRATDERGATADQTFTVTLTADEEAPAVTLLVSADRVPIGGQVQVRAVAVDNRAVTSLALMADDVPIELDAGGNATLTNIAAGVLKLQAVALDAAGNSGTASREIRVFDPADLSPPVITVTSPPPGDVVTYLTTLVGSVTDEYLDFYEVAWAPKDSGQFTTFARGTSQIVDAELGVFDPTLIPNDQYDIRITARDLSGNINWLQFELGVTGNAKLGNFRLEFTDLSVPLAGIPIQITRIYDTLYADEPGDFGYGWTFALAEGRIREAVRQNPLEPLVGSLFGSYPFRSGTRVYINLPDGRRGGFTFDPLPVPGLLGTIFYPHFRPDPGIDARLEVQQMPLRQRPDGAFRLQFGDFPYNPSVYTVVTRDQLRYRYDQFQGLLDITDRNGVRLTYTDDGIFSSLGPSIRWTRDARGRITEISDPAGNSIEYGYDSRGDLVRVTNQAGIASTLAYRNDRPHYLDRTSGGCSTCHPSVRVEYDDDGRVIATYDALGNVASQSYDLENNAEITADRLGRETRLVFDDRGNITSMTDPTGSRVRLAYDANDNVIAFTDPRGHTTSWTYDARGNVTSMLEPAGPGAASAPVGGNGMVAMSSAANTGWTYTYTSRNDLATITDPLGRVTQYLYDAAGNLVEIINPLNDRIRIGRDSVGRPTFYQDPAGYMTLLAYAGGSPLPAQVTNPDGTFQTFVYNVFGAPTHVADENGHATVYTYDASGRPLSMRDALGGRLTFQYDGPRLASQTDALSRVTRYEYDAADRVVRRIDPLDGARSYAYDANNRVVAETDPLGRVTAYAYREDGLLDSVVDARGGVSSYAYDAAKNLVAVTDANQHATVFSYDALNQLTTRTDPRGGLQSFVYDAVGNLAAWTNENGHTTTFGYDALDRLTTSTDPLLGVTAYTYDSRGNLIGIRDANNHATAYLYDSRSRLVARIDPLGGRELFAYDARGNLTAWTDANGHANSYAYDPLTRLIAETDPAGFTLSFSYDAVGNLIEFADQLAHPTAFAYDALDRVVSITDALQATTLYAYDAAGHVIARTDPLGRATSYAYDELHRLISETDPRDSVTRFGYDAAGNLAWLADPLLQTTYFEYDESNLLVREIDPLGAVRRMEYDPAGNLTRITDRNGRVRTFAYDALERRTAEHWLDAGQSVVRTIAYSYDAVGNLTSAADPDGAYAYAYDPLDRLVTSSSSGTPGALPFTLTWTYDAVGNVLSIADNFGVTVTSAYDPRDLLISRTWQGGGIDPLRVEFEYNGRGERTETRRFAGAAGDDRIGRSLFDFDAKGRLSGIAHHDAVDQLFAQYDRLFNPAHELIREVRNGQATDYTYDPAGQLIAAIRPDQPDESYDYDANGNRTAPGYQVGPANRLLSDGAHDYAYDAEGNLVRKTNIATGTVTSFDYDHRNRVIAVDTGDSGGALLRRVEFTYDLFDRRIAKSVDPDGAGPQPAQAIHFYYAGEHIWMDADEDGSILARYFYGDGPDEILARHRAGEGAAWYLTDALGTVRHIVDAAGAVINHIEYDSFGNVLIQTDPAAGDRYLFTGREYDSETGLYYYRARYYDPQTGRFLGEDPIGFAGGDANLYRYVGNAPTIYVDPSGLVATISYPTFVTYATRIANAAAGHAIGFACGYLEALYLGSPDPLGEAWDGAVRGAILGAALGVVPLKYQIWVGIAAGVHAAASSEDFTVFGIRATCIAVQMGASRTINRFLPKGLNSRAVRNFLLDESGSLRKPGGAGSKGAVGKSWKNIVHGKAHGSTPGHKVRTYRTAIEQAKSGTYAEVHINTGYKKVTGVDVRPNRRPDVISKRTTGEIDTVEVPQATDIITDLLQRNYRAQKQLPSHMRGHVRIERIR